LKSTLPEALGILFSGQIARRELLGGAKDEFTEVIRNVHDYPAATRPSGVKFPSYNGAPNSSRGPSGDRNGDDIG